MHDSQHTVNAITNHRSTSFAATIEILSRVIIGEEMVAM